MHSLLLIASGLAVLLAAAHSLLGERLVFARLARRQAGGSTERLPDRHFAALRTTWHLTSLLGLGFAGALFHLAGDTVPDARWLLLITLLFAAASVYWIWGTRGRHPGWIVMVLIAACTGLQLVVS
ncbi:hypothetical protein GWI72_02280 [Microvirga tunisiensis]|uniref:DUF3325 domain-containing protein n=1 Tax=Pannonibacter tanglangensis TaxID=2750084 RepID=A0A7X5EZN8_9HYPH|nr:hypothetical protein [Pannonibacter sp. XCT-53]NBN77090.1 hypothetical protein [Pannonibacter sp. XCT-53]